MKNDINLILNKLVSYATDNLLLDELDALYTLNRLSVVCGAGAVSRDQDADYGEADLAALLNELTAACPAADKAAVRDILFPMPRTVNMYFGDALGRNKNKAFDFLFELYANGGAASAGEAVAKDGYLAYVRTAEAAGGVTLDVKGEALAYIPRAVAGRIAELEKPDVTADDTLSRMAAYVTTYGGVIAAKSVGDIDGYLTCADCALTHAKVKTEISGGAVKTDILDYPVPVVAFNGIAKNTVAREVARIIKAAEPAGLKPVVAAAAKDGITFYLVFAGEVTDPNKFIGKTDALTACGVFETVDCSGLLSVLEKGTALSTDLSAFKPIYDKIGGVKLGAKAAAELGGALAEIFKPALQASATTPEAAVKALFA
ncbi:MAG: hypothetical protein HDT28_08665 [Clostridiales bacterium]|nr:hypothetical protein [Clostridiales bacterium]